ncbi:MAG: hypothetical protein IJY90_03010 [Clostridia bacterium]|nr:hypothetical protein [Clostridia bacterium]
MNKNQSTRKFQATIIGLCCAFVLVIGAVVGVWAATSQTINAGFKVNYNVGENVAVEVRTESYVPTQDLDGDKNEDGAQIAHNDVQGNKVTNEQGYIVFNAADTTAQKAVYIGDFTINPQHPTIEFYFTIHSLLGEGEIGVELNPVYAQNSNFEISYLYHQTDTFNLTSSASLVGDEQFTSTAQTIGAGEVQIIKIVANVDDKNAKAELEGQFLLNLYYHTGNETAEVKDKALYVVPPISDASPYYQVLYFNKAEGKAYAYPAEQANSVAEAVASFDISATNAVDFVEQGEGNKKVVVITTVQAEYTTIVKLTPNANGTQLTQTLYMNGQQIAVDGTTTGPMSAVATLYEA